MVAHMQKRATLFFSILLAVPFHFLNAQTVSEEPGLKQPEPTKIIEVVTTDSLPSAELLKRALNWVKTEHKKYVKTNGVTTTNKAECSIWFPVKPKELNPECDYTGKIDMKLVIECKDSKYKYTISQIKHVSKSGKTSAGSVDNTIPECGTMVMSDITWKKLRGEALVKASSVVSDLKEGMKVLSTEYEKDEW